MSASLTAAVASGFPLNPLTIWGFPPNRSRDRNQWLRERSNEESTLTFFEAPHRIIDTLKAAADILGDRPIMVGRELTKLHQELVHGTASELAEHLKDGARGEFTIVVGPMTKRTARAEVADEEISARFGQIAENASLSRREAITATARHFGISSKQVYAAIEKSKK